MKIFSSMQKTIATQKMLVKPSLQDCVNQLSKAHIALSARCCVYHKNSLILWVNFSA